jgi:hypothetical protein
MPVPVPNGQASGCRSGWAHVLAKKQKEGSFCKLAQR